MHGATPQLLVFKTCTVALHMHGELITSYKHK